ncbi:hypothetical protein LCG56_28345 (plasmid) [Pseudomonas cannabina pv. alisalensis]|uniref:Uncharacterized protein n=1 Tax=Pseudomonas syringae pv. maculicola str. ES4326 TaxID=629265 RepID=A0A8T8CBN6_PSEYM|nr:MULTISPECIES: hypothetical protein [Pseudomonas syringae group]QHF00677.1 hypothetical protein PMA4326_029715 [Pseudomonas syringae pv. maculicola str. ES4326]UBZ00283.1 hypothetical protein LCG56_28345 [Pseudomonas cannabina pv. alisalensis]
MDKFSAEPKPPKTKQSIAGLAAIAAFAMAGLVPMPVGGQVFLTLIGIGVFGFGAVMGTKHNRAYDPLRGSPDLPHAAQLIAFLIGICSIGALCYLGLPLKEGGFTSADWWLLLLSITALGGFGYASRIQKRHNKAYLAWRDSQSTL